MRARGRLLRVGQINFRRRQQAPPQSVALRNHRLRIACAHGDTGAHATQCRDGVRHDTAVLRQRIQPSRSEDDRVAGRARQKFVDDGADGAELTAQCGTRGRLQRGRERQDQGTGGARAQDIEFHGITDRVWRPRS
jgi:hypothetical protein